MVVNPPATDSKQTRSRYGPADWWACALLVLGTILWSLYSGKDLNWDQLNYHFYSGYSFFADRLSQDFMPASGQSYLNPLVYAPFYWMVSQGWHSILVASVLAAFHALNIVIVYLLSRAVLLETTPHNRIVAMLGATLSFLSPIFLMEAGTTFADITTSVFLLASLLCLLQADNEQRWWRDSTWIAGILAGAAVGLKLSNLVFGPALAITVLALRPTIRGGFRGLFLLGCGAFTGLALTHGYWSWQLLTTLGDPSSPTLSSLLSSPDIPPSTATFPNRFAPETLLEALALPFRLMHLRGWIYVETPAPDLRFAGVTLLLLGMVALVAASRAQRMRLALLAHRKIIALVVFFVSACVSWIATSANGRYGIVVSILCGAVLALTAHLLSTRKNVLVVSLGIFALLQWLHMQNGQLRWTSEPWTSSWYAVSVPESLTREPYLYISVGGNSNSYIVPFLAEESAFTNPIGQYSFDFESHGGARLTELIDRHRGRVRIISQAEPIESPARFTKWFQSADTVIARLGFTVDSTDCLTITTAGPNWQLGRDAQLKGDRVPSVNRLRTCGLKERRYEHAAERARITAIAKQVVEWCPKLFRSPHTVVEQTPEGWYATYVSTDTTLLINDYILLRQPRAAGDVSLGTISDWEANRRPECAALPERFRTKFGFD